MKYIVLYFFNFLICNVFLLYILKKNHFDDPKKNLFTLIAVPLFLYFLTIFLFNNLYDSFNFQIFFSIILLFLSTSIIVYSFWALVGYGFTINILIDISNSSKSLNIKQHEKLFLNYGLPIFMSDRMQILYKLKLIIKRKNKLFMVNKFYKLIFVKLIIFFKKFYKLYI